MYVLYTLKCHGFLVNRTEASGKIRTFVSQT